MEPTVYTIDGHTLSVYFDGNIIKGVHQSIQRKILEKENHSLCYVNCNESVKSQSILFILWGS